jgi:hypothetical protein
MNCAFVPFIQTCSQKVIFGPSLSTRLFVIDTGLLPVDEVLDATSAVARRGEQSPLLPLTHDKIPSRVEAEEALSTKVTFSSSSAVSKRRLNLTFEFAGPLRYQCQLLDKHYFARG